MSGSGHITCSERLCGGSCPPSIFINNSQKASVVGSKGGSNSPMTNGNSSIILSKKKGGRQSITNSIFVAESPPKRQDPCSLSKAADTNNADPNESNGRKATSINSKDKSNMVKLSSSDSIMVESWRGNTSESGDVIV